ncbi:MAG: family 10 glycosylhydrolase, partial [Rubrivivax sp.]|nr:family 10 glycosylhydrolase [Rubrivivax sp.]
AGDAIYPSTLEPWAEWLSGEQGKAPWGAGETPWDPLAFWVQEAHRRGLELHAWFNPYRARPTAAKSALAATHIAVRQPAVVKRYGDQLWMDPAEPAAVTQTLAVVADVLRRYDVDGVHIDDYFYPYPVQAEGADVPFPDDEPWARYQLGGGALTRDDWRRAQVDDMVRALQRTVRDVKPHVRLGVSPFGLPRPDRRPPGITGFSQFDKLYADAERWLEQGWLDYWAPQLYWPIAREGQQFPVLLDYWLSANPQQRHVWPGLFTSQSRAANNPWPAREFVDQIDAVRARPAAGGHIHFSLVSLMPEKDPQKLGELLKLKTYGEPALVPVTTWLSAPLVGTPVLRAKAKVVTIEAAPGEPARRWAVWQRHGGAWRFAVQAAPERVVIAPGADAVAVAAVDRLGRLSESAMIRL